jgi:hypothetical protein
VNEIDEVIKVLGMDGYIVRAFVENLKNDSEVITEIGETRKMFVKAGTVVVGKQHMLSSEWMMVEGKMFMRELRSGRFGWVKKGSIGCSGAEEMKVAVFVEDSVFEEFTSVRNWAMRDLEDTNWAILRGLPKEVKDWWNECSSNSSSSDRSWDSSRGSSKTSRRSKESSTACA